MKDSLLLPVVFLGLFVVCFVLFSLGYLMYLWDTQYVPADPPTIAWAVTAAPVAMRTVFIPATLVAFFLVVMRIARKPGIPFFSYLLALLVIAAALYYGISASQRYLAEGTAATRRTYDPLVQGNFNVLADSVVYPFESAGNTLGASLIADPKAKPAFAFESKGVFRPSSWTAEFANGKLKVAVQPSNPGYGPELAPRGFLAALFGDMKGVSAFLERFRGASLTLAAIAFGGVVLFSVGCIGFAWVTRWPLLNAFLVAVCFRGLFWLFSVFSTTVASDAFALVVPKAYMPVAPAIGLGALGVVFLIWDILFIRPPARD